MRSTRWWVVPGVAAIVWLLQWVRNILPPFADVMLSFDGDVALHITLGNLMIAQGGLLPTEPTNYLMHGAPFIAHEWLSELVLALSDRAFGLAGPIFLLAGLVATLTVAMLRRMLAIGAGMWPAVLTLVVALMVQNTHLHPRPHLVTWALAFVFASWCDRVVRGDLSLRAWLLRSAALVVLWAQLHAGFLVVFPILLAFVAGAGVDALSADVSGPAWRRAAGFAGGAMVLLLASAVNPWGFALHAHFLAWLGNDYMTSFTTEFQPPDFRSLAGMYLLAWLALTWLALAASPRRPDPSQLFLTLGLMVMALTQARHGPVLVTLTAPFVALRLQQAVAAGAAGHGPLGRVLAELDASSARLVQAESERGGWGIAAVVAVVSIAVLGVARTPEITFRGDLQPVAAVDWVQDHPDAVEGRMFNPFRWGAYLAWRLYPDHQTFINSWHDHLGEDALRTYFEVHDVDPDWEKVLRKAGVEWVIYDTGSKLGAALDDDSSWERVYRDNTASVWRRKHVERPVGTPAG
ncbi:MAG: hypothetical protein H6733_16525 [Alphaproteobacteria bacterium]|nr:hypothetical protein [Alphaproteobacteria bacterium]